MTNPIHRDYSDRVAEIKANDGPDESILTLINDPELERLEKKLASDYLAASASADELRIPHRPVKYKAAEEAFKKSPRGALVRYIKCLPLVRQFKLSLGSKEVQDWLLEELLKIDRKNHLKNETQSNILIFIQQHSDLPYPILGLDLSFRPHNGRIRMDLEVRPDTKLREEFKKKKVYEYLVHWRERLTEFERERALVTGFKSELTRKEQVSLDLYRSSKAAGGNKSYEEICQDLSDQIYKSLERTGAPTYAAVGLLMDFMGMEEEEAVKKCKQIIQQTKGKKSVAYSLFEKNKVIYRLKTFGKPHSRSV